jgi:hypothetical protein
LPTLYLHYFQAIYQRQQQVFGLSHVVAGFQQVADKLTLPGYADMGLYDVAIGLR